MAVQGGYESDRRLKLAAPQGWVGGAAVDDGEEGAQALHEGGQGGEGEEAAAEAAPTGFD